MRWRGTATNVLLKLESVEPGSGLKLPEVCPLGRWAAGPLGRCFQDISHCHLPTMDMAASYPTGRRCQEKSAQKTTEAVTGEEPLDSKARPAGRRCGLLFLHLLDYGRHREDPVPETRPPPFPYRRTGAFDKLQIVEDVVEGHKPHPKHLVGHEEVPEICP
jgi:hypothetical protein